MAILAELWILAVVAASCFVFVLPLALYLSQRGRNRFVAWHAAEALNAAITYFLVAGIPLAIGYVAFFRDVFSTFPSEGSGPGFPTAFGVGLAIAAALGLVEAGVGIWAAVQASNGAWSRHPLAIPFVRAHHDTRPRSITTS